MSAPNDTDTDATTEDSREPGPGQMTLEGDDADSTVPADPDPQQPTTGTLEVLPPAREAHVEAFGTLREHVGALREAKFFAEGVVYTSLVPDRWKGKPGDATAAILFGAEVGLSPIASLRSIIVIHGMPGFEARTMKALLKGKGYKFRTIEKTATRSIVECESPDGTEIERAEWTIEDAIRAEYVPTKDEKTGKWRTNDRGKLIGNMKYITDPKTMLDAKSTAEVCRSIAPHVLLGMPYAAEDLEDWDDYPDPADTLERDRPRRAGGVDKLRDRARQATAERVEAEEIHDAEVVPDEVEATPEGTPDQPPAETSPAPSADDDTADEAQQPSAFDRPKAMRSMHAMFREAELGGDDNRDDRLAVMAEIIASPKSGLGQAWRKLGSSNELTDQELAAVIAALGQAKPDKRGGLKWYVGEAINAASLREAGMLDENGDK
jgi:hypothetical protein